MPQKYGNKSELFPGNKNTKYLAIFFMFLFTENHVLAGDYYHPGLLRIGNESAEIDESISILADNDFLPGTYEVNLYVNKQLVDEREIQFILREDSSGKKKITPCIGLTELESMGIRLDPSETFDNGGISCLNFSSLEYISFIFASNDRSLHLSIPQTHVDKNLIFKAQEKLWNDGIDHFSMNYAFSSYQTRNNGSNQYLNLRPSVNLGAWRYRNYSVWTRDKKRSRWNTISNTVSRSLTSIRSEISLGDSYSSSTIFDSFKLRGISLRSSDQMLPINERGYVPSINGVASSDAQITVRQNGNTIYQANVPAGPYSISDYYPASFGGDLDVTLREADGTLKNFIVPFSALPIMEKQGKFKYSLSSGRHIEEVLHASRQYMNQLEMIYGLTQHNTIYGGLQASPDYKALALGMGSNLGNWGAVSGDLTQSHHKQPNGQKESGKAVRLNYGKGFSTNTTLSLVYSRALDPGFVKFRSSLLPPDPLGREKSQFSISVNQALPDSLGGLSLRASNYRYRSGNSVYSYSAGYNGSHKGITYGVYFNKFRNSDQGFVPGKRSSSEISVTLSIPLSFLSGGTTWVNYNMSRNDEGDSNLSARLNGSVLDNRLDWGVYQGWGNHGAGAYGGANAAYNSSVGSFNAGYSYAKNGQQNYSYGMSGAVTVTEYGSVLSRPLHESNALVIAPDAGKVRVQNYSSVETNASGLAIVPGLSSFRANTLALDTSSFPDDVDIMGNINTDLFPTKGALIVSRFDTRVGYKLIVTVANRDVPTGAEVRLKGSDKLSAVSGFNQFYLVAPARQGQVELRWQQKDQAHRCVLDFDLQQASPASGLYLIQSDCRAPEDLS